MGVFPRTSCPRCRIDVDRAGPPPACPGCGGVLEAHVDLSRAAPAGVIRATDLVVCTVTGHGLKQPEAAAAQSGRVIEIDPSLTELERHLRRTL
jgi:threonine synthase